MPQFIPSEEERRQLDLIVDRLRYARRTFTEGEAFQSAWNAKFDLIPQHDPKRFVKAYEPKGQDHHWLLTGQSLANARLLERLWSGAWDGRDLDGELKKLDCQHGGYHVFCPIDKRLEEANGVWRPAGRDEDVEVPPAIAEVLDSLATALVESWRQNDPGAAWTCRRITEALGQLGWDGAAQRGSWQFVRTWLLTQQEIARVGPDHWVPADNCPAPPEPERLRVRPIYSPLDPVEPTVAPDEGRESATATRLGSRRPSLILDDHLSETESQMWVVTLRTFNIVGGYLSIPASAQSQYPFPFAGSADLLMLSGKWHETGDELTIWLDRRSHRLYGPDLAEQLAWCDCGRKLRVQWLPDVILLRLEGIDSETQREESRLVDFDELDQLRGYLAESYCKSIDQILRAYPGGLAFRDLVEAVRTRQRHDVSSRTIRAILHAAGFTSKDGRWMAQRDPRAGGRSLRRASMEAMVNHSTTTARPRLSEAASAVSERLTKLEKQLMSQT